MDQAFWGGYDMVFFDCDSTLSSIEGIDELARLKGKEWRVGLLTEKAMNGDLELNSVYGKRLRAIRPTRGQMQTIVARYYEALVPDAQAVIDGLRHVGKEVFIISGGIAEAVRAFGVQLGLPPENVHAVELEYNQLSGEWWRYYDQQTQADQTYLDHDDGPLTVSNGKAALIEKLRAVKPGRCVMIGDGISDLATKPTVDLFVGFGGVMARERVKHEADAFIQANSLAPLLPLVAGTEAYARFGGTTYHEVAARGLRMMHSTAVSFREAELQQAFEEAFRYVD